MREEHVPVTSGSSRAASIETTAVLVSEAWFPAGTRIPPHTHSRPVFGIMMNGSFDCAIGGRRLACMPSTVWTEPVEERHENLVGSRPAHVIAIQPDPRREDLFAPFDRVLDEIRVIRFPGLVSDARRVAAELRVGDSLSALAVDGIVLAMLATAARLHAGRSDRSRPPDWLLRARDLIHDGYRGPLALADIADAAQVHPSHLSHAFRRHFGTTPGEYARQLRVRWAARELAESSRTISDIALAAGYSDQCHLTREFRRLLGGTPAAYRAEAAQRPPARWPGVPNDGLD